MSPLSFLKYLPQGRLRRILGGGALFVSFVSLPFLFGSDTPLQDMQRMIANSSREKIESLRQNPLARPDDFNPIITSGPLAISQTDADRGSWSWNKAKNLSASIWTGKSSKGDYESFYCGCGIEATSSTGGSVDLASCGVTPRKSTSRARRMEWEHIVPASVIARGKSCWTDGAPQCVDDDGTLFAGRSCCEIADPFYNMAATDPVNLVPAVGEVNGDRLNFPYGMIEGSPRAYGACEIEIDQTARIVEPPALRRGDIARIYAYMSRAYGIPITQEQANTYRQWMIEDPVSDEEIAINQAIAEAGHRANPFVLSRVPEGQMGQ